MEESNIDLLDARTLQVRRAHASARPTSENPAWRNCHRDMEHLFIHIEALKAMLEARKK